MDGLAGSPLADAPAAPPRLSVERLTCAYGKRIALADASLDFLPGEFVAVLGPNGAGKSTLLRAVAGLAKPTAGTVRLSGRYLASLSASLVARSIAYAAQTQTADWPFTVREFVELGRLPVRGWFFPLSDDDRRFVAEAIYHAGLDGFEERFITELSGGEWQRARIAQSLARGPEVLLLDEPTAHLDPRFQIEILRTAKRLAKASGLTVVATLHDVSAAAIWADRIVFLSGGRVVAVGTPHEVVRPDVLEQVYGVRFAVGPHPVTGAPCVAIAADEAAR
ncbi:MAG TPA: ABC transporter ATP-binding protein [Pirellulales bacterium]